MKFEESETLQNIINAYAGESMARNRYTFYSKAAKKEGYEQISQIFLDTAENEREHAKLFYKYIPNADFRQVNSAYPFFIGKTVENLEAAAKGEREEWEFVYKRGAQTAKDEGFDEISKLFSNILEIEKYHSHRFQMLADKLSEGQLFKKDEQAQWVCRKCGHILISKTAPENCPVCNHPRGYFQIFGENY